MNSLVKASLNDLDSILNIDKEVIGNTSRKEYILHAIREERCIVLKEEMIAGFLIYDMHFFGCCFISLIVVKPSEQRKGHATTLLKYMIKTSNTTKIFSSTNESNLKMQEVFIANGFIKSGYIDNLDIGDPEIIYYTSKENP